MCVRPEFFWDRSYALEISLLVDIDTTSNGVQLIQYAFIHTVLIKCGISAYPRSLMRSPLE